MKKSLNITTHNTIYGVPVSPDLREDREALWKPIADQMSQDMRASDDRGNPSEYMKLRAYPYCPVCQGNKEIGVLLCKPCHDENMRHTYTAGHYEYRVETKARIVLAERSLP